MESVSISVVSAALTVNTIVQEAMFATQQQLNDAKFKLFVHYALKYVQSVPYALWDCY